MLQHVVEVLSLLSDDVETDDAVPGENLKLRLKGIEEEEILPGFILCNADNLCHSGRTFDAQVGLASAGLHYRHNAVLSHHQRHVNPPLHMLPQRVAPNISLYVAIKY